MLRLYGLRLLVALLTFGVGVAAASLLGFSRSKPCGKRTRVYAPVAVSAPVEVSAAMQQEEEPVPPQRACTYSISGGVLNSKAVSLPQPAYPPVARAARARGTVSVEVLVDESGDVIFAKAVSGHPLLQQSAVKAAREAEFSPTFLSGQPVKVKGVVNYNFALE